MSERSDYEQENKQQKQLDEKEHALWQARNSLEYALTLVGRDPVVDYLNGEVWTKLIEGYVLKEHYDTLEAKYWVCKKSHDLQYAVHNDHESY